MRRSITVDRRHLVSLPAALSLLAVAGCGWIDWGEGGRAAPVVAAPSSAKTTPPSGKRQGGASSDVSTSALPPLGAAPRTVTVGANETLAAVAKRARVDVDALAAENGLIRPYTLRAGQTLRLPEPPPAAPAAKTAAPSAKSAVPPQTPAPPETEVAGLAQAPAAVARPPAPPEGGGFLWPVKGRLLSTFGSKANGLHNDGINIAARRGQPVRAIAPGVVAYAGNELRGFGNLVLIRHDGGWVSAYAHADSIEVARGDKVRRGQVIARIGDSGGVGEPQLHFELRRGKKAVDPLPYLKDGGA